MADVTLSPEEKAELDLDLVACAAAEAFTDAYYYAVEKDRGKISTFYCPKQIAADSTVPFIAWNSVVYNDGPSFQEYLEGLSHTHFEIEGLDCSILNRKFLPAAELKGGSNDDAKDFDRRMSIAVVATGSVRLEEPLTGPMREFAETFVLVPNTQKQVPRNPMFEKGWQQEWLIQTQNFRFTEWGASEVNDGKAGDTKANGVKNVFQRRNQSVAKHFAAAGLTIKGQGKV
ncbi:hypothetical protein K505DRAFT_340184 [Melanomma pulvis-pyrius CBS 109.77]|uniref:NTF2 domain-containing protein n=1 Tax=Melanomma pulvis-pyrius CBS 109.77 TaxID=1314802 RepID=A0A6A6X3D1_9PLEO|nr:hypothetical protein K505DRAFT_340184 [Melanomma pulvis-pyrius CBS 109.77]